MILELIDFQFSIILHKKRCKDTKKYSNYQISVFYKQKVASSDNSPTTYDFYLYTNVTYQILFGCTFKTFHHRENKQCRH